MVICALFVRNKFYVISLTRTRKCEFTNQNLFIFPSTFQNLPTKKIWITLFPWHRILSLCNLACISLHWLHCALTTFGPVSLPLSLAGEGLTWSEPALFGLHCLPFCLHLWGSWLTVKLTCFIFRPVMVSILGVWIFINFMVIWYM